MKFNGNSHMEKIKRALSIFFPVAVAQFVSPPEGVRPGERRVDEEAVLNVIFEALESLPTLILGDLTARGGIAEYVAAFDPMQGSEGKRFPVLKPVFARRRGVCVLAEKRN